MNNDNPLFQANPLPNLYEEYKEPVSQYEDRDEDYEYRQPHQKVSNYNYHQQNVRGNQIQHAQPHEIKKANFEQNRRSNISNVSSNIVSSRERNQPGTANFGGINHTKNTNQGYVKMTGGPQFGIPSDIPENGDSFGIQRDVNMKVSEPKIKQVQKGKNTQDSILNQYSHKLPPHQLEYKSGFQEMPPPIYNASDSTLKQKAQARPLPGNHDLENIDFYNDLRYSSEEIPYNENKSKDMANVMKPPKPQTYSQNDKNKAAYKPYSLKEYKEKLTDPKMYRLGGLGANVGTEEWQQRNNKLQAMKYFAGKVKVENRARSMNQPKQKKEQVKELSKREKALLFAKNVPKPKLPPKKEEPKLKRFNSQKEYDEDDIYAGLDIGPEEPKLSTLDELNQKHEDYQNEVNDIKKLFM